MKRILITGAGGYGSIGFIRCLRLAPEKFYIVGVDQSPQSIFLSKHLVDNSYVISEPNGKNYIEILNKIIKKERIDLLWSQPQPEVQAISKYREKIKTNVFLPDKGVVDLCFDKYQTVKILSKKRIPIANSILVESLSDLKKAFKKIW